MNILPYLNGAAGPTVIDLAFEQEARKATKMREQQAEAAAKRRRSSNGRAPDQTSSTKAYEARCMDLIEAEPINWLWPGRIALGKLNLVAGNPGGGKSQLMCHMAASVTTARPWPDGSPCPRGSVIVISCEDDASDTIKPRLMAAGADLKRVHVLDYVVRPGEDGKPVRRLFDLGKDTDVLAAMIRDIGDVGLVTIDPVTAYLGKVDSHKNAEVRGALAPLQALAGRTGAAFVLVSHLSKGSADANAMARVSGSFAWVAICRAAYLLEADPKDPERKRRVLAPLKNNLGDDRTGFALHIESVVLPNPMIETSRIVFEAEPVEVSVAELLAGQETSEEDRSALDEAMDFLREHLKDGPQNAKSSQRAADDAGISQATLRRARKALRVKIAKSKVTGYSVWALPEHVAQNSPSTKHGQVEQDEQVEQHEGAQHAQGAQGAQL